MPISFRPLSHALGAEVQGVDLSRSLSNSEFDQVHRQFLERGILLFRGQKIDHAQHIAFTRRFGPLAKTGLLTRYAPPGFPDLFTVTNMKIDGVRSETWNAARQWHSDQSFLPVPARATVSTGMVFSNAGATDLPSLLVQADRALYRAKEKGRNRLEVTACEAAAAVSEGEQQAARARLMRRQEVAA